MASGTSTYKGMAVPLNGQSEIKQVTAATDVLTITKITGGTGDVLVIRESDLTTERFVVRPKGYLSHGTTITTAPTTGLLKGDWFIGFNGSVPRLGVCSSTAAQTIKYIRTRSKSFASASA